MKRTAVALLAGVVIGAAGAFGWVTISGGAVTYRVLPGAGWPEIRQTVERDGCEPFEVQGVMFARCPRFYLWR